MGQVGYNVTISLIIDLCTTSVPNMFPKVEIKPYFMFLPYLCFKDCSNNHFKLNCFDLKKSTNAFSELSDHIDLMIIYSVILLFEYTIQSIFLNMLN